MSQLEIRTLRDAKGLIQRSLLYGAGPVYITTTLTRSAVGSGWACAAACICDLNQT